MILITGSTGLIGSAASTFYLDKKIKLKKYSYILRQKKGSSNPKDLLFRFAYHDFYFLYEKVKEDKFSKYKDN